MTVPKLYSALQSYRRSVPSALAFPRLWQTIGWFGVVTVIFMTLTPSPPSMPGFLNWDKAQHIIAYAGLMWWYRQAFAFRWLWVIFLITLGVTLEFLQGLTVYRHFDYDDMIANGLGVSCGVILAATPLGRIVFRTDRILKHLCRV